MKKITLCTAFVAVLTAGFSQSVTVDLPQLDFGDVLETEEDSLQLTLTNNALVDVAITGMDLFATYGNQPFRVEDSVFTLASGESRSFWVWFQPEHNIRHNSELLIHTDFRGTIAVDLLANGRYSLSYYASTFDDAENTLRASLKNLVSSMSNLSYNQARDAMYLTIDNKAVNGQGASQNEVEGVYTGFTVTGFTDRTDAQNQGVNTEHTFPQSFYNSNLPMRADIHHLFITEGGANSSRSNLPFGVVSNADWQVGGSKRGGGQFEPRDVQKGPTARAMMYFVTRYQDYSSFFAGQETVLRQWAADFPPTVAEEARNDATQTVQGNRNPFIDYPQFLERITNLVGTTAEPDLPSVFIPQASVQFGVVGQAAIEPFNWVIMNDGNRTVSLDNFALGTSVYAIENPPSGPVDLEPGEDLTLRILMDSTISLGGLRLDTLTFTTDLAAMPQITVPVAGEVVASVSGPTAAPNWSMYPNPASANVTIAWPAAASRQLRLVDVAGRTHWEGQTQRDRFQLSTTGFAPGTYWLEVNGPAGRSVRQLLIVGQ